jgi:4-hydroxythreonine-4-phosphate dehydrogenase
MRATIGVTAGDPAGIGLEVVLKSISALVTSARWAIFTDREIFERNAQRFSPGVECRWIESLNAITDDPILFLRDMRGDTSGIEWGKLSALAGARALAYLEAASSEALSGKLQAIVTAPVSKEAIGGNFHGQTDFLADRAGVREYAMAFFAPTLKIVLATIHVSLREALSRISTAEYVRLIRFVNRHFPGQRIAVAAINPHAGEGGMFGREDIDVLTPAVIECVGEGISVSGPHSADSLYYRAHTGEFDVVIAPYHDQGLIPVKLIAHSEATNVTLGLPYVRTSPDHGTAFAIAGKGVADFAGMKRALALAEELATKGTKSS